MAWLASQTSVLSPANDVAMASAECSGDGGHLAGCPVPIPSTATCTTTNAPLTLDWTMVGLSALHSASHRLFAVGVPL